METKKCPCCLSVKTLDGFGKDKTTPSGYKVYCRVCKRLKSKKYYDNHRDSIIEYRREYIKNSVEKRSISTAIYRDKNKKRLVEYNKQYYAQNKDIYYNNTAKRRSSKLKRTPSWLTDCDKQNILFYYKLASRLSVCLGIKFHVDHIIPLQGKNVSGLHVPNNLQVIPAKLNYRKNNRFLVGEGFANT